MLPESNKSKEYSCNLTAIIPIADIAGRTGKLENILSQSSKSGVKIILVHDIQDQNNSLILKKIFQKYCGENDIYIEGYYGTAGQARNAGFQLCKTEWVCFWDSDDYVHVSEFFNMVKHAQESNCEIAIGLISVQSENKETSSCLSDELIKNKFFDLQIANFPAFTRMAFLTSLIKSPPFPIIKIGEDLIFLLTLDISVKRIHLSNVEVYRYHVGSKNQTTSNYNFKSMYELLIIIVELIEKNHFTNKRMAIAMLNKVFIRMIKSKDNWVLNKNKISTFKRVILIDFKNIFQFILAIVYLTVNRPKIIKAIHES
jgi:glycosyltransferase involved in cell wall biosynthesis